MLEKLRRAFANKWIAGGGGVIGAYQLLRLAYQFLDAWGNVDFLLERIGKLRPYSPFRIVTGIGQMPPWLSGILIAYFFAWISWGRHKPANRPRLVLEVSKGEREVEPLQDFAIENSGSADAFDVQVNRLRAGTYDVAPNLIHRIKPGGRVEVRCDVHFTDRPGGAEYDASLGVVLPRAFRALEVLGGPDSGRIADGRLYESVRISYVDQDHNRYVDWFLISFSWGIRRLDSVRLRRPSLRERLKGPGPIFPKRSKKAS